MAAPVKPAAAVAEPLSAREHALAGATTFWAALSTVTTNLFFRALRQRDAALAERDRALELLQESDVSATRLQLQSLSFQRRVLDAERRLRVAENRRVKTHAAYRNARREFATTHDRLMAALAENNDLRRDFNGAKEELAELRDSCPLRTANRLNQLAGRVIRLIRANRNPILASAIAYFAMQYY